MSNLDTNIATSIIGSDDQIATSVIGSDDRILVGNTTIYPYSAVVRVEVDFNGDGLFEYFGSGAMIGPNDVLTAGHLLWDSVYGLAKNVMVTPAQAGNLEPFGVAFGKTWIVPNEYISLNESFDYDIGVINLSTNIGNSTGWFGLQSVSAATVTGSIVTLAGYPADLQGGLFEYTSSDNVDFVIGNRLYYNGALDTYFGNSGGPLWWTAGGSPYIVGVNTFQLNDGTYNGGTELTLDFFNRVTAWSHDSNIATAGNDYLTGTSGSDTVQGQQGDDTILGGNGSDLIYGNQGNDVIYDVGMGDGLHDTIYGGQGNDSIGDFTNSGSDIVYGNFGSDLIGGGVGDDTIYGGQDNDTISADGGTDLVYGNLGNDSLDGGNGVDRIYGGQGNDTETGGAGNDVIYGNFANDSLSGQDGNDTIYGGQDNDVIVSDSASDQDRLFGNVGADTFDFAAFSQHGAGVVVDATSDRIADFQTGVDKVALDLSDFSDVTPDYFEISALTATTVEQAITAAGDVTGQDVIFVAGATDGFLLINASGGNLIDGADEFAIVLQGHNSLADFAATDLLFA